MSQHKRTKRRSPMTAILAVLLILAGIAAIVGSLWMQENEINTGAELYENLSEQLKLPSRTEDNSQVTVDRLLQHYIKEGKPLTELLDLLPKE